MEGFCGQRAVQGCWLFAWHGRRRGGHPDGPHQRPIPTFRHFREKLMTAWVPWTSSLSSSSTVSTPLHCPEAAVDRRGAGGPGRLLAPWMHVLGSPSAVYVVTSHFPEKEINIQIHLLPKWSFAAKEKCYPNSRIWRQSRLDLEICWRSCIWLLPSKDAEHSSS